MQKEAYFCASRSKNTIDIVLMEQALHTEPDRLRSQLQQALNNTTDAQGRTYDASLLGYGLCSNGIVGLTAEIPIVAVRGHDCITLLLGSKERYRQYFDTHRGVYWFSPGWIETDTQPGQQRREQTLEEYIQKYGQDNAGYLMEVEHSWMKEYKWATYIDWPLGNCDSYKKYTKRCANSLAWNYDEIKGDPALMQRLVDGHWNQAEFLIVQPGQEIAEALTEDGIIKAQQGPHPCIRVAKQYNGRIDH